MHDDLRPLDYARKHWVPTEKPVAYSTIWRWAKHGTAGERLKTLRVAGKPMTTREWLHDYFERSTAASQPKPPERIEGEPDYGSVGL